MSARRRVSSRLDLLLKGQKREILLPRRFTRISTTWGTDFKVKTILIIFRIREDFQKTRISSTIFGSN
jgi:hypothetical protein